MAGRAAAGLRRDAGKRRTASRLGRRGQEERRLRRLQGGGLPGWRRGGGRLACEQSSAEEGEGGEDEEGSERRCAHERISFWASGGRVRHHEAWCGWRMPA